MVIFMYLFQKKTVNPITFIFHTDNKLKGNRKEEKIAELTAKIAELEASKLTSN